ncbi:HAMP domain-containing sensor histidine kinase [Clostridium aestuarii]|uniref:histidine kinase n=1 Tax=Clostridium aestuarii TaxID=338193 RepID=A0ABT4D127_9CLOT|nr:HAMP domain-containing sensor histidine kinase [Clostridium aestuarii]MCY6484951.1 HAMP domain-containing sensor histidine kinase [Clostridium aestuarii]
MQYLIIIFLIIGIGIFGTRYILLNMEIKNVTNELNKINENKTNSKILLGSSRKQLEKLSLEINKTLEEKQKNQAKYKRMDLELRQAIANISHDLRTPLTSIMGYMQLMEENDISQDEKKQYIDIVKNRTKSLKSLITSFYDLSRLEANEYEFELKSLNLYNIMSEIIVSFYNDFVSRGVEPIIDIDEKVFLVIVDENAVKRIISNLIQNMIKYGKEFVSISLKQRSDCLITTFTNDAPNLNEEDAKHLFERFFTADHARTGKSTGLGLAITKELVEQMGHTIWVELSQGKLSIMIKWKMYRRLE